MPHRPCRSCVDEALAREAVKDGGIVIALCATGTTIAPTRNLFERASLATGAEVEVRLVPGAWVHFKTGEHQAYLAIIADAADAAVREGAAIIVLAQASMAGAAALCREARPLTSPTVGLAAAVAAAQTIARAENSIMTIRQPGARYARGYVTDHCAGTTRRICPSSLSMAR